VIKVPPKHPWAAEAATLRAQGTPWAVIGHRFGVTEDVARGVARRWVGKNPLPGPSVSKGSAPEADSSTAHLWGIFTPEEVAKHETKPTVNVRAPVVHTTKSRAEGYLVVPDLQAPFHEPTALEFVEKVRREFGIPKDNVLFTGDEIDNFHGKGLDKRQDPDAGHTPRQELAAAVEELKRWYAMYPTARLAVSNHGTRYERRAAEAEISSQWLRLYREVIEAPPGWQWQARWLIQASKHHFVLEHGHEGSSRTEAKVLENGYSTVHGHFTKAQIVYVSNHLGRRLWGFCAAALIDYDTYAFAYAKKYPRRADNGVGVILDGGRIPLWVPHYTAEAA
jgi:hypothetical protein